MSNVDKAVQEVLETVDEVCDLERMTREEYGEFLEALIADLQIRDETRRQEDGEDG